MATQVTAPSIPAPGFRACVLCLGAERSSVSGRSPVVFAVAAETGWPEERILFMPLARLAQYQHCLLRRNGVRTAWNCAGTAETSLREQLEALRAGWGERQEE